MHRPPVGKQQSRLVAAKCDRPARLDRRHFGDHQRIDRLDELEATIDRVPSQRRPGLIPGGGRVGTDHGEWPSSRDVEDEAAVRVDLDNVERQRLASVCLSASDDARRYDHDPVAVLRAEVLDVRQPAPLAVADDEEIGPSIDAAQHDLLAVDRRTKDGRRGVAGRHEPRRKEAAAGTREIDPGRQGPGAKGNRGHRPRGGHPQARVGREQLDLHEAVAG